MTGIAASRLNVCDSCNPGNQRYCTASESWRATVPAAMGTVCAAATWRRERWQHSNCPPRLPGSMHASLIAALSMQALRLCGPGRVALPSSRALQARLLPSPQPPSAQGIPVRCCWAAGLVRCSGYQSALPPPPLATAPRLRGAPPLLASCLTLRICLPALQLRLPSRGLEARAAAGSGGGAGSPAAAMAAPPPAPAELLRRVAALVPDLAREPA